MIRLRVWANLRPMGWFGHAAGDYFFEYDPQWLDQPGSFVLAPQFSLSRQTFTAHLVRSFFENLLPEGLALDDIVNALALRGASPFELLGHLGRELPGVLSLLPEADQPTPLQQYRPLNFQELSGRLQKKTPLLVSNDQTTMSLAGAQEKMGLRFDGRKSVSESMGTSPTTHILKPETRQTHYQPSAVNEYACMQLARAMKLPVPDTWLLRVDDELQIVLALSLAPADKVLARLEFPCARQRRCCSASGCPTSGCSQDSGNARCTRSTGARALCRPPGAASRGQARVRAAAPMPGDRAVGWAGNGVCPLV